MQLVNSEKEKIVLIISFIITSIIIAIGTINTLILMLVPITIGMFILLNKPKFWIYILSIYFPFETIILKYIPGSIAGFVRYGIELISIILFMHVIIKHFIIGKKSKYIFNNKISRIIIIFILISVISALINSVEIKISILGLRWFIRYIPVYFIILSQEWKEKEIERYIYLMFYICIIECIIGILQLIGGSSITKFLSPVDISIGDFTQEVSLQGESKFAIYATMGRYSVLALFLSLWIPFMIAKMAEEKKYIHSKIKIILIVCFNCLALLLTYARQGVFGVILGTIVIAYLTKSKIFKLISIYGGVLISGFAIIVLATTTITANDVSQDIVSRFLGALTLDNIIFDLTNYGRLYFMTVVTSKFLTSSPILGYGIGMYGSEPAITYNPSVYFELGIPIKFSMDVFWVSVLGQVGILGVITWLTIYYISSKKAIRLYKNKESDFKSWFSIGYLGMIAVILLESFFSSNLNDRYQSFFFWVITAFLVVLNRNENIRISKESSI